MLSDATLPKAGSTSGTTSCAALAVMADGVGHSSWKVTHKGLRQYSVGWGWLCTARSSTALNASAASSKCWGQGDETACVPLSAGRPALRLLFAFEVGL